jgi:hypothetical protein
MQLVFVETSLFTKMASDLTDDELREAQDALLANPEAGRLIPGTGGARKLRVGTKGKGKRGGARIIYYYAPTASRIYLFVAYQKGEADTLTVAGKRIIRAGIALIQQEHQHG